MLAVVGLVTFSFVSRFSEYLLIRQETERLGIYYQAVGTVTPENGDTWADSSAVIELLNENPLVQTIQTIGYTSAVMQGQLYNVDTDPACKTFSMAFYGTLQSWDQNNFYFRVDTVLSGYPEYVSEGASVVLFREDTYEPESAAYAKLEKGQRYLALGFYHYGNPNCRIEETEESGRRIFARIMRASDDSFFTPVSEDHAADWSDLENYRQKDAVSMSFDEQRALNIIPTEDMSTLPMTQNVAHNLFLADGRWLNTEDNVHGRKVCVVNEKLASLRGLKVGDFITLKLRDIASYFGNFMYNDGGLGDGGFAVLQSVETKIDSFEIVGIYGYFNQYSTTFVNNFTYVPASVIPESFAMTTKETLWETGWGSEPLDGLLSQTGNAHTTIPHPGDVSFSLISPEVSEEFLLQTRDKMAALGWGVELLENNWANFQAAAVPMKHSSLLNAVLFSILLLASICLLAAIYYRMRYKDIAIARALGVSFQRCAIEAAVPFLFLGFVGIGIGGWLGWQYTWNNASDILSTLSSLGNETIAVLPKSWLPILLGAACALLLIVAEGGAVFLAGRPVLELMQNGMPLVRKERTGNAKSQEGDLVALDTTVPSSPAMPPILTGALTRPAAVYAPAKGAITGHVLQFVWRHITRAKLKSSLSILLAAVFTLGLAMIRLSIAGNRRSMDWLYENTMVEAELLLADATQEIQGGGFLRQDTINALLGSGYVTDVYLEGSTEGAVVRYAPGMENSRGLHVSEEDIVKKTVRAFADESVFLSPAGSGGAVTITYLDGWDGSLFSQEWTAEKFPIVLPKSVYARFGSTVGLSCKGFRVCEVVGYYDGEVAGSAGETDPVLIPLSAYQGMGTVRSVAYGKVHVTLAPSLNRELDRLTQIINDISASQSGMITLRAIIWDEELRLAVAPLENSIELMRVLYPVTLMLSMMVAAGIALLYVMTSAKEAAIMRVLGTTKRRSAAMLALQNVLTSLAGLLLGLLGILAYTGRMQPELLASFAWTSVVCALLYLLATVTSAGVSSMVVTSRNPLELLQVKE